MLNKSFKSKHLYIILICVVIIWIVYACTCREHFEAELETKRTNKRIDELTSQIDSLRTDFQSAGKKMESQGQQAAAMSATLQAIPTGFNGDTPRI